MWIFCTDLSSALLTSILIAGQVNKLRTFLLYSEFWVRISSANISNSSKIMKAKLQQRSFSFRLFRRQTRTRKCELFLQQCIQLHFQFSGVKSDCGHSHSSLPNYWIAAMFLNSQLQQSLTGKQLLGGSVLYSLQFIPIGTIFYNQVIPSHLISSCLKRMFFYFLDQILTYVI